MINRSVTEISIVLLLVACISLTNFSSNIFYTHQQALAIQNSVMKYLVAGFVTPREGKPPSEINVSDFILENIMLGVKSITSSPSPSSSSSLPATLNDFVNEQISTYKQRLVDFQIIKSNTTPIDNNPTYQVQYTQKDGRATFDTLQIWTISGNKIYTIIFNADPGDYPTYLPVIQKMIDSFDVLDDNNTNNSNFNNQMKLRNV